ncbi:MULTISPECIES: 8-amino-7-oxononanoate synthase [unclassified Flavobacterium]|uniref:aminotransferase class I/II-fold pyridoxal phosphate-dependent enzyme n=1 Tax=unclassified Flavobacterium TaxID=196869 RepID=UPI001F142D43|nr:MULTISPECIES: 8-amino-7-oxononanoate synthase [unclassified Flavobacterium]UMY66627.1 8-amino-7-oxononanoate synthase [Flavobacterium sp. HJ-32-4]
MHFPRRLSEKLEARQRDHALRELRGPSSLVDFSSNDYLGFARSTNLYQEAQQRLEQLGVTANGATGSRLITGNHSLYESTEAVIAAYHDAPSALIFNSGYDANVGFFSCVPQKDDIILYDELCHASIRDGLRLSPAKSYKFRHNDTEDLEALLKRHTANEVYVVTETVFSMDGDSPMLESFVRLCEEFGALLVLDEAHAVGVVGDKGEGLAQQLGLHTSVFARLVTFGKAMGCHGAAILGEVALRSYLVNYARSFIYTTGLPPHSLATIQSAYAALEAAPERTALRHLIAAFNREKNLQSLKPLFIRSMSAIQCAILPGNENVKNAAAGLQAAGFDVKPILSPTVPAGQERLRFCLHSFNSEAEIQEILRLLRTFTL